MSLWEYTAEAFTYLVRLWLLVILAGAVLFARAAWFDYKEQQAKHRAIAAARIYGWDTDR